MFKWKCTQCAYVFTYPRFEWHRPIAELKEMKLWCPFHPPEHNGEPLIMHWSANLDGE